MNNLNDNCPGWGRARAQVPSAPKKTAWQTKEVYIRYTSPGWGLTGSIWKETQKSIGENDFWNMLRNIRRIDRLLRQKPTRPTVKLSQDKLVYYFVVRYDTQIVGDTWRSYPAEEAYLVKVRT